CTQARRDHRSRWKCIGYRVECLQAVSGYAEHDLVIRTQAPNARKLLRGGDGDTTRGFGEDARGLGEQAYSGDELCIGNRGRPAIRLRDTAGRGEAVRRVADRERTRDGRRDLRLDAPTASLHEPNDRCTAG